MKYVPILSTALILLAAPPASAQIAVSTFEQLQAGVKTGDRLFVIDKTGVQTEGRLQGLSPEVLTLAVKGRQERRFTRDDVVVIRRLVHDPVWNGAAVGATVADAFVLISAIGCSHECGEYVMQALVGAAVWGGGIGALVDAAILTPQDIFRTGPARVDVHPTVGRDRVGAALTLRW
jgi:hypothetical protein